MDTSRAKKTISVTTSCYNEEGNLQEWYDRTIATLSQFPCYDYEFIVADNCSTDRSRAILRDIAARDKKFKVIFNSNNFGYIRSPYNAFLQGSGDAVVWMCSDLQEPPEVLEQLVQAWEKGFLVVCAVKPTSYENALMFRVRSMFYWLMRKVSESPQIEHFTNFGLYDRRFVDALRKFNEPYPYFRGLVTEIGFSRTEIPYAQECRRHGKSTSSFSKLYDYAMTGFVNHTKLPLRLAALLGFALAGLCFAASIFYFIYKLVFWETFSLGIAPVVIGVFFISGVQLVFIGIIGEYLGAVWTQVKNRPLVIEDERINF